MYNSVLSKAALPPCLEQPIQQELLRKWLFSNLLVRKKTICCHRICYYTDNSLTSYVLTCHRTFTCTLYLIDAHLLTRLLTGLNLKLNLLVSQLSTMFNSLLIYPTYMYLSLSHLPYVHLPTCLPSFLSVTKHLNTTIIPHIIEIFQQERDLE